ncbi:DNA repair exonuclease [Sporosarcina luteola]|uniref:DNA repair exonuclease n=1 Tax=Sporosarcina luteola TaxID=582850 RepID=A0A511Z5N4_9BACL|nr:DNA repair exonuclease [Sporosarcina luteola]GEN82761.1 DNA repair exonuclease [Sporosarcina luteola]
MSSIRFIHAADLHLDSPFKGLTGLSPARLNELRESTFTAFDRLIRYALKSHPDFVLIVGDLYDGEDRSLRAQRKFQEGMEKLAEAEIPVYITYGNHDHVSGSWTKFELPGNVFEFKEHVEDVSLTVRGQEVVLHGFSYPKRHVRERMITHFPTASDQQSYHIGLLHGSVAGDESHAVYAPFTIDELQSKHYHYWALGHIHKRQQLSENPPVVYPGNIQGRHRNESGEKGFYEVELSNSETVLSFIPTSAVHFGRIQLQCNGIHHANEWITLCEEALDSFVEENGPSIIDLEMHMTDAETVAFFAQQPDDAWLETIREVTAGKEPFVFVHRLVTVGNVRQENTNNVLIESVLNQVDSWSTDEWIHVLDDLYGHVRTVRYLDALTEDDISELKKDAERLLLNEML